jgi:transposase
MMKREELMKLEKEEIIDILFAVIAELRETVKRQPEEIAGLKTEITELKTRLNQNSRNSSKPPSSDGPKKPVSLRVKSGKKAGAQKGHKGHGHKIEQVNKVIEMIPELCPVCGTNLTEEPRADYEIRYPAEIPEARLETIKYEFDKIICPNCGAEVSAVIPYNMSGTFTYGDNIRALTVTLSQYGMMSEDKTRKILSDWLGCSISVGTVHAIVEECAQKAELRVLEIKEELSRSDVLNVDETGVRVSGRQGWFHVLSNAENVLYTASMKRGKDGIEKSGVIAEYEGTLVHDCLQPYFNYDLCTHALCNAHILRELKSIIQNDSEQTWCKSMTELLIEMKDVKTSYQESNKAELSRYYKTKFHDRYAEIVEAGKLKNPPVKGSRKQSKAYNLINRLEKYRDEFCRFIADFDVPFDNNQAERDVRALKVKAKVSGCFRTEKGADSHAAIASVIQTAVKKARSVLHEIKGIISGSTPDFT